LPLIALTFECSECGRTVFGDGIFLQNNDCREGFCNMTCIYKYARKAVAIQKASIKKPVDPKEEKKKVSANVETPKKVEKLKPLPPQPPPGRPG
jgi:hypothetical protein